ncbi:MAG: threonine--tRNA ligase [Gammaproteobacteria bacterium]|jgi:threonyl-tRNA synthetase|nr:threonine--tRNA ligase [Gammaproteobacteria bacterium]
MPVITLPDGSTRTYSQPLSILDVAADIGPGLAKSTLAGELDGELHDACDVIHGDVSLRIITPRDEEGLEIIRHSTAHLLGQAIKQLYPDAQMVIGPVIENGFYYDIHYPPGFNHNDLEQIEQRMRDLAQADIAVIKTMTPREQVLATFSERGEDYKLKLVEDLPEVESMGLYQHADYVDMCRGPHVPHHRFLGSFKLTAVSGSYWRGDSNNEPLQRIYGTAWRNDKELKAYLLRMEEAEKRDHRKLGQQLDLFHFEDSAPGQPFWHDKGWLLYSTLLDYMRNKVREHGYIEVQTPQVLSLDFWKYTGHWDKYRENMFVVDESADTSFALKPMNCPGNVQIFKQGVKSYRDLPVRMAEFGKVFRHEASGARHGLMRVQGFTQDDAHIFCTPEQLEDEVIAMCGLINEVYTELGFTDIKVQLSTRPEQRIGSDADWDRAEQALENVCRHLQLDWSLNPGDGAFYAPKLDFQLHDAIGRVWQCGTIQVDMNLPNRLDILYTGEDGEKHRPHMVHRAIMGSIERFLGVLIEHYAGDFPLWLAPVQVMIMNITDTQQAYAKSVHQQLVKAGIRAELDTRNEKVGYKIREHTLQKVPVLIVVGDREVEQQQVAVRLKQGTDLGSMSTTALLELLQQAARPGQNDLQSFCSNHL